MDDKRGQSLRVLESNINKINLRIYRILEIFFSFCHIIKSTTFQQSNDIKITDVTLWQSCPRRRFSKTSLRLNLILKRSKRQ